MPRKNAAPANPPDTGPTRPASDQARRARLIRNVVGIILLLGAFAGILLPLLQGIVMVVIGLLLIDLPFKKRLHQRLLRQRWYRVIAGWLPMSPGTPDGKDNAATGPQTKQR